MSTSSNKDLILQKYWDSFFVDEFASAISSTQELLSLAESEEEKTKALDLHAKILLKKGYFSEAKDILEQSRTYSGLKLFLKFLLTGELKSLLPKFRDDNDSRIYKAQATLFHNIYWGNEELLDHPDYEEPNKILETVFADLVDKGDIDRALLASTQIIELIAQEKDLSKDIIIPVIDEQLKLTLKLADEAKYESTKAKVYLCKAKLFKDRQSAEDAEILFGKEHNQNGLAEVYMLYGIEFLEDDYVAKALELFDKLDNRSARGFLHEALASHALAHGEIIEAMEHFNQSKELLSNGGIFERYGLEIQTLSMLAIKGENSKIKDECYRLIAADIPKLFKAQILQILANTLIQYEGKTEESQELVEEACQILEKLKRFNQLLHAKNILFQIALLGDSIDPIIILGEEIIQLASRLGDDDARATKYVDLAFAIIRFNLNAEDKDEEMLQLTTNYFNQAIEIYKTNNNLIGEADAYQAMGNMFANIGNLEEAFNAFKSARQLYKSEKALLQVAITDTLIGILMLDFTVLNEHSYAIAFEHLESAFMYYNQEGLHELSWKNAFYIADLNEKVYMQNQEERFKKKAKHYYIEMYQAVKELERVMPIDSTDELHEIVGINTDSAFSKAEAFFKAINEDDIAQKFRRNP